MNFDETPVLGIYKPKGPTSHDMIYKLRKLTGIKKIGHAGTLDPLASGVLVVGITKKGTTQLTNLIKQDKEYIAKVKFGETSTTYDEEGEKTIHEVSNIPTKEEVIEALKQFEGEISQIPPIFSALKIKGKSAYKLARENKEVKLEPRQVKIHKIELVKYEWPYLEIKVDCGSGVYIRSLAFDIGEKLNVGGYLAELERTRVGEFRIEKAIKLEELRIKN